MADYIPFTVYDGDIPVGETERILRNKGLGLIKGVKVYTSYMKNVKICQEEYLENERKFIKRTLCTPVGNAEEVLATGGAFGSSLRREFYITGIFTEL